ncbi:MAG TPA: penicillin acylase family protein [Anaerolineales bacterium]|nr:penicillin acylase family protein [Anaerolineales bacterium]
MSQVTRRIVIGVLILILAVSVLLLVLIPYNITRSFPQTEGEIQVPGLDTPVEVYRDSYGVPHIYASSAHDLFFTQGYVHAQDRFWQMDFWRHIGSGRLSEMFGDSLLENDQILRTLGFARVAQVELESLDPTSMSILESYSAGVNAYLDQHQGADLSLEYLVLKMINADYQPEPWQPLHSMTWAKVMAWDLGGNMDDEIEKALLLGALTPEQVADLVPPYPEDKPVIVPGFQANADLAAEQDAAETQVEYLSNLSLIVKDKLDNLDQVLGPRGIGIGSNSWAISGSRTATGMPLLANDPHLGAQIPAIWYEVGLHCTQRGEACPYQVTGFSFAGVPGVVIGHNENIAWGFTNVGPDVQDLYIEKINPENPNQYEVNGQWVDMDLVSETIRLAGGEEQDLTVRYTRHGPIISDTAYLEEDFSAAAGLELPADYALALRWTALEPNHIFRAIWRFNRAANWDEFREDTRDFAAPAQNLIYADVQGNIGYQMPGNIPIRAKGDGSLPVPGWTDEYEWTGYIPFEEQPFSFNPPEGYIVTANNAVVEADYPYLIATVFAHGYRAQRIVDMIEEAPGEIDSAYIQEMQGDNKDLNAETLVPILLQIPVGIENEDYRQLLVDWDYQADMESNAAALFEVFWKNLLELTFLDELPEGASPGGGSRWFEVFANLVEQPDDPWWDIPTTTPVENRDFIFNMAFSAAVNELKDLLGQDAERWTWGDLHTLNLVNASLGDSGFVVIDSLFNRGGYRTSGGSAIVNATGWDASKEEPYVVGSLPSMRMILDLSELSNSLTIHTTGQSGHAYHDHYVDMTDPWRQIQYHAMLWDPEQVENEASGHLRLVP